MRFVFIVLSVVLVFVGLSGASYASSCPDVDLSDSKINADTNAGLSLLSKLLSKLNIHANYTKERNSILVSLPNADQLIVTLVFYKTLCDLIMESNLTLDEKLRMLTEHQEKLFRRTGLWSFIGTAPIARRSGCRCGIR